MPVTLLPSLLLSIVLIGFMPGPANLFSLHCSMKNGTRKAMAMWFGLLTGFTIAALIGAMITHLVGAMMGKYVVILKYIGCAYILYLAWQIYRSSGKAKESDKTCTFLSGIIILYLLILLNSLQENKTILNINNITQFMIFFANKIYSNNLK